MIEVVAAMIRNGKRFLICKRPEGKANAGLWEFPGGKVEPHETHAKAIVREIREELDCTIEAGQVLADTVHTYPHAEIHLTLFEASLAGDAPKPLEHAEIAWIARSDVDAYAFCPADTELIRQIF